MEGRLNNLDGLVDNAVCCPLVEEGESHVHVAVNGGAGHMDLARFEECVEDCPGGIVASFCPERHHR